MVKQIYISLLFLTNKLDEIHKKSDKTLNLLIVNMHEHLYLRKNS
jgi:hypothetical protein